MLLLVDRMDPILSAISQDESRFPCYGKRFFLDGIVLALNVFNVSSYGTIGTPQASAIHSSYPKEAIARRLGTWPWAPRSLNASPNASVGTCHPMSYVGREPSPAAGSLSYSILLRGLHLRTKHCRTGCWNIHCRLVAVWSVIANFAAAIAEPSRKPEDGLRRLRPRDPSPSVCHREATEKQTKTLALAIIRTFVRSQKTCESYAG